MPKFTKKCMAIWTLSETASGWPYICLLILTFLNHCISVTTNLGDFVRLGPLFLNFLDPPLVASSPNDNCQISGAIIGDGDRKSWDPRGPMIWDNFSIFRTNCAIPTSYIHARVVVSRVDVVTLRDQILTNC